MIFLYVPFFHRCIFCKKSYMKSKKVLWNGLCAKLKSIIYIHITHIRIILYIMYLKYVFRVRIGSPIIFSEINVLAQEGDKSLYTHPTNSFNYQMTFVWDGGGGSMIRFLQCLQSCGAFFLLFYPL